MGMRRFGPIICILLCFLLLLPSGVLAAQAYSITDQEQVMKEVNAAEAVDAEALDLAAHGAILVEPVTGAVLFEKNPDEKQYPASMTKLMTLVVAFEEINAGHFSLDDKVTVSEYAASMGGSQVYLEPGETFTLREMLIAVAVGSANDASVAVAEYIGGSNEKFIAMMNEKAAALGMTNTHYMNTHGLHDDNHYTTPRDMAILSRYAIHVAGLLDFTSIKEYQFRPDPKPLVLYNTNKLLFWYEGTDGLKTGTTSQAGRNLSATCQKSGLRLISVIMGGTTKNSHYSESMKLLNYGFNSYENKVIVAGQELVTMAEVNRGDEASVDLLAADELSVPAPRGGEVNTEVTVEVSDDIFAPVGSGDVLGTAVLLVDGKEVDRIDLIAATDVERQTFPQTVWRFIRNVLS